MSDQAGVLATDLDGTFLPLEGVPHNIRDLKTLQRNLQDCQVLLCFVTGRHIASVEQAIHEHQLLSPEWIICDVGTTIYRRVDGKYAVVEEYRRELASLIASCPTWELRHQLESIPEIRPQEEEKQGEFKLSYYVAACQRHAVVDKIQSRLISCAAPYSVIPSVDPFNGDGLIDLLPHKTSKGAALNWWAKHLSLPQEQIVFAGDSGNDFAALVTGFRSILVGNASPDLIEEVTQHHAIQGWNDRLYVTTAPASSGVLEGCRQFGLIPNEE